MSDSGACWRCRYFDRDNDFDEDGGFCRRYPPISADSGNGCMWPGVGYIDWCGEFREDGNSSNDVDEG